MREVPRQSRRSVVTTLALAGLGMACRTTPTIPEMLSLDVIAERYVRLTLRLAQHQPSLVESWLGPEGWRPGPRRPVAEIAAELASLRAAATDPAHDRDAPVRTRYLRQQLEALWLAARRLAGETMPFAAEAQAAFGDEVAATIGGLDSEAVLARPEITTARAQLEHRLPGRAVLHQRYLTFRTRHAIAPERVRPALHAALAVCRARVRAELPLPDDEHVDLEAASGVGLAGLATYQGRYRSRATIDIGGALDLARLVWLVAHETYPGHHVQHVLADSDLVENKAWTERQLHPSFGRHLLLAEGAAEAGAALLLGASAFEEICRELAPIAGTPPAAIPDLVNVHQAVSELDLVIAAVARAYLDGLLSSEAAADQLSTQALVADARQFLFLVERQRTRLLAYPIGRRLVAAHIFSEPPARRWKQLARVATTLTLSA